MPAIHALACRCDRCTPAALAPRMSDGRKIALVLASLAVGEAFTFVLDRLIDGPGLLVPFGL